jgi:hypothetical protein
MRLPVSGLDVNFRLPDGHDDLALLEAGGESDGTAIERALEALCRLAKLTHGIEAETTPLPWQSLTITDFEYALLGLRRFLFGDTVRCLFRCACSERMEIEFSIATLLREAQPRTPRSVLPSTARAGWFVLREKHITFRLPVVNDQLDALASPSPYAQLEQSCIEGTVDSGRPEAHPDARTAAIVERAMEAMAPTVSRPIAGRCAACGEGMSLQLHVPSLVLDELRASAAGVHSEIHAIAATYHWQESAILALPQLRRQAYTEAIRHGVQGNGLPMRGGAL